MDVTGWILIALLISALLAWFTKRRHKAPAGAPVRLRQIVVDGTNVLFWRDDRAQLATLQILVRHLRRKNISPVVFLDASSRHHLGDRSLNTAKFAQSLGLLETQVKVCPAGTEADKYILEFAQRRKLAIVSNDRFRDRPLQARNLKLVKGRFQGERLFLKGL